MGGTGCTYDWPLNNVPDEWIIPFRNAGMVLKFSVWDIERDIKISQLAPDSQPSYTDYCMQATLLTTAIYSPTGIGIGKIWLSWDAAFGTIRCSSATRSKVVNQLLLAIGATKPLCGDRPTEPFDGFLDLFEDSENVAPQVVCDYVSQQLRQDVCLTYRKNNLTPLGEWCMDFRAQQKSYQAQWIHGIDLQTLTPRTVLVLTCAPADLKRESLNDYPIKNQMHETLSKIGFRPISIW